MLVLQKTGKMLIISVLGPLIENLHCETDVHAAADTLGMPIRTIVTNGTTPDCKKPGYSGKNPANNPFGT